MTTEPAATVCRIVADQAGVTQVTPETALRDLKIDSLDALEIALAIEDETGVEVTDDQILDVRTVADLVRIVESQMEEV